MATVAPLAFVIVIFCTAKSSENTSPPFTVTEYGCSLNLTVIEYPLVSLHIRTLSHLERDTVKSLLIPLAMDFS